MTIDRAIYVESYKKRQLATPLITHRDFYSGLVLYPPDSDEFGRIVRRKISRDRSANLKRKLVGWENTGDAGILGLLRVTTSNYTHGEAWAEKRRAPELREKGRGKVATSRREEIEPKANCKPNQSSLCQSRRQAGTAGVSRKLIREGDLLSALIIDHESSGADVLHHWSWPSSKYAGATVIPWNKDGGFSKEYPF
ncbi:hypothetical protein Trydic_g9323 [Trypoxylus dichotomus]